MHIKTICSVRPCHLAFYAAIGIALTLSTKAFAGPPRGDFVDLVKRLSPTVVDVSAQPKPSKQTQRNIPRNLPKDHPFRRFFEDSDPNKSPRPNRYRMRSLGSGFIIDAKGVIITNHHVISNASDITINLSDGRRFKVKVLGSDSFSDIAVLQIISKEKLDLPVIKFGDPNRIEVGEWVFAIGTPFGLRGTVTAGIVSAVNRDIGAGFYDDFIQTDAAINRGNSGGPLFNTRGEVIGINTIIVSPSGGSAGAGFAIPVSTALPIIDQLIKTGTTSRGWLGVQIQAVTENLAATLGLDKPMGALVAEVSPNSPADKAGVKQGDVIVKFNDHHVRTMRELPKIVSNTPVGSTTVVEVIRNGKRHRFTIVLGRLEAALAKQKSLKQKKKSAKPRKAKYGLALKKLDTSLRSSHKIPKNVKGVWVKQVDPNSTAAQSGLRGREVILEADKQKVRSPEDVYRIIAQARRAKKKAILLRIWRGTVLFLALSLTQEDEKAK